MNRAIEVLVPVIAAAPVDTKTRERWLERLWEAIQDQGVPYIEALGEDWDRLCVTPEIANTWADRFLPLVEHIWSERAGGYFAGTSICLASLYAADRHAQLIALVDSAPFKWWHDRQWAVNRVLPTRPTSAMRMKPTGAQPTWRPSGRSPGSIRTRGKKQSCVI